METIRDMMIQVAPDWERYMVRDIMAFGRYHYKYDSGREGEWIHFGISANKTGISIYVVPTVNNQHLPEMYKDQIGRASIGKSCIRTKSISNLNLGVIEEILVKAKSAVDS